ncbi:MAG: GDP-mannose 4,6-dehydratase [Acetobacterium woodii]|nr:GDP-mannose 4,6-dehydratase [Acetobacterium woodii]MBI5677838.1 GDP-mannose 4,6-dehydratase [Planctomycetota bacterium]
MTANFWKNKNVFITGCTGLVGSWLTKLLLDEGANVVGLVRDRVPRSILWSASKEFDYIKDRLTVVNGNVEDYFILERAINEYEIEVIFHLAAQTIVGIANRNPLSTLESNIRGTYNLLEACRRNEKTIKAVVVASSDKAYGEQKDLPYNEDTPLQGSHPYDVSKSCADLIAYAYYVSYKVPVCVTRCGNFYGPGDLNFNRIVPQTIRHALNNERPVIRSDGKFVRDYFFVKDGALAYKFLAEKMYEIDIKGEAFNFSLEEPIAVLDLVNKILRLMKREDLKPDIRNEAVNEIRKQYLSARKSRDVLGWKPTYTIEESIEETAAWYKEFLSQ